MTSIYYVLFFYLWGYIFPWILGEDIVIGVRCQQFPCISHHFSYGISSRAQTLSTVQIYTLDRRIFPNVLQTPETSSPCVYLRMFSFQMQCHCFRQNQAIAHTARNIHCTCVHQLCISAAHCDYHRRTKTEQVCLSMHCFYLQLLIRTARGSSERKCQHYLVTIRNKAALRQNASANHNASSCHRAEAQQQQRTHQPITVLAAVIQQR